MFFMEYQPKQNSFDFERYMLDPIYFAKETPKAMSQVIKEFKDWRGFKVTGHTVARYDGPLRMFCLTHHDPLVSDIKIEEILDYMMEMHRLGWKRNGITITALSFRKFFEYCQLRGYRTMSPELIPLPRKEFNLPRVANEKDYRQMLRAIPGDTNPNNIRNLALLNLVWDSWARSGEIVSLNEEDLEFNKDGSGQATIKTEKSRGRRPIRQIFWTAETGKNLRKWLKVKHRLTEEGSFDDNEAVFISIRKCGSFDSRGMRMTSRGVNEVFRMISNRARLPSIFNPHSCRHYGGRHIVEKGGSSADVSNILGHSHLESSYIYQMLWGTDLRERYRHFKGK